MLSDIEIANAAAPAARSPRSRRRRWASPRSTWCPTATTRPRSTCATSPPWRTGRSGRLVLMTAMSPTPAGEGKTTTTVGLTDALHGLGHSAMACLREPSMGPVFGMKGGAAGGGYAQVVPMADINLHFTGDFAAIAAANNLLAALIDNHVHHGNELDIDVRTVTWKRVVDLNDRALRDLVVGLGGVGQRLPARGRLRHRGRLRADGDLLPDRVAGPTSSGGSATSSSATPATRSRSPPATSRRDGAMTVLLRDALAPNLVQTLEHAPAFVHGGPFANIAHGCSSVIATRAGAAARRLRRHRGRLRRRPGRGEVRRHQVPQVRPASRTPRSWWRPSAR